MLRNVHTCKIMSINVNKHQHIPPSQNISKISPRQYSAKISGLFHENAIKNYSTIQMSCRGESKQSLVSNSDSLTVKIYALYANCSKL